MQMVESFARTRTTGRRSAWAEALKRHVTTGHNINQTYPSAAEPAVTALQAAASLLEFNLIQLLVDLGARYRVDRMSARIAKALFEVPSWRGTGGSDIAAQLVIEKLPNLRTRHVVAQALDKFIAHFDTENMRRLTVRGRQRNRVRRDVVGLMVRATSLDGMLSKSVRCVEPMFVRVCVKRKRPSKNTLSRLFRHIRRNLRSNPPNKIKERLLSVQRELMLGRKSVPASDSAACSVCSPTTNPRCNVAQCGPVCAHAGTVQLFRLLPRLYGRLSARHKKYVDSLYVCNIMDRSRRRCLSGRLRRHGQGVALRSAVSVLTAMLKDNKIPHRVWNRDVDFKYGLLRDATIWRNKRRADEWVVLRLHNHAQNDTGHGIVHEEEPALLPVTETNVQRWETPCQYAGVAGGVFEVFRDATTNVGHAVAFTVCRGRVLLRNTWGAARSQEDQYDDLRSKSIRRATLLIPPLI